jgi:hypothetical protein
MKRLYIVVEGQTEEAFVKEVLTDYFNTLSVNDVRPIKIQTSPGHRGGITDYSHFKHDVLRLLNQKDVFITTFIDFYRIPSSFPEYQGLPAMNTPFEKATHLERALINDINHGEVFEPYIQLHEFEALLFSSIEGFKNYWPEKGRVIREIKKIIEEFPNPEDINDQPNTSPSNRLKQILPDYQKILYGNLIALHIGLDNIRSACPRFNNWIDRLTEKLIA